MRASGCWSAAALSGLAPAAMGGVVSVNFWDVRAGYGVFADGGSGGVQDQGTESLGVGATALEWPVSDGVAQARARVASVVVLDTLGGGLDFSVDFASSAWAEVGDNPDYGFERGAAEAWLDWVVLDITLTQSAVLEVSGGSFVGYGMGQHVLGPGNYLLEMNGPMGLSAVDVGASASAMEERTFQIAAKIIPSPWGGLVLMCGIAVRARRRGM